MRITKSRHHWGLTVVIVALLVGTAFPLYRIFGSAGSPGGATAVQSPVPLASRSTSPVSSSGRRSLLDDVLSSLTWRTVYQDEFNGRAGTLSDHNWVSAIGAGLGIGKYQKRMVRLDGHGHLLVSAKRVDGRWYSGLVASAGYFGAAPGRALLVQSRLKLVDGGPGYWPAFWGVGKPFRTRPASEPAAGETDIAETINDDPFVAQFLHCGRTLANGPCKNGSRPVTHYHRTPGPSGRWGWHVYSWLWFDRGANPYVAYFIDNKLQLKVTERQIGKTTWDNAFDHPYYFIYDVAIGGWARRPTRSTALSGSMSVDYITIRQS